jgi:non-specific riboncleoside hydrolase
MKALLTRESIEQLPAFGKTGEMLHALFGHYNDRNQTGVAMHDVNTLFYLLHPEAFTTEAMWIDVQTDGPANGETVGDIRGAYHDGKTNANVCVDIDAAAFNKWFLATVKAIDEQL